MADYNSLNKAKAKNDFDIVFTRQRELNNAIMSLVRTAYVNHHEETDLRNIKLYECLEEKAKFIIGQLSDEDFTSNLKNEIQKIISRDVSIEKIDKDGIVQEINSLIDKKREELKSKEESGRVSDEIRIDNPITIEQEKINSIFLNKDLIKNVSNFTLQHLKHQNKERLVRLNKEFGTRKQSLKERIRNVPRIKITQSSEIARGFIQKKTNSVRNFGNILRKNITSEKIRNTKENVIKRLGEIKKSIKKRNSVRKEKKEKAKKKNSKKGFSVLSFAGSVFGFCIKPVGLILGRMFFGVFSVIKGIFKITFNIFKYAIKGIIGLSKLIFNACGKIMKGLGKATIFTIKTFKALLMTPKGMYYTGYVIGFIYGKIKKLFGNTKEIYDKVLKKSIQIKKSIHKSIHNFIMSGADFLIENKGTIKSILRFIGKIPQATKNFFKRFGTVDDMLKMLKGGATAAVSTGVGAIIGRIVGSFFGPGLGAGIGTGLGAIAGMLIGEKLNEVPESAKDKIGQVRFLKEMNDRYRQKSSRKQNALEKYSNTIDINIGKLDDEIKKKKNIIQEKGKRGEDVTKLEIELTKLRTKREKYQEMKKTLIDAGNNTIELESNEEQDKHKDIIDKLSEKLDKIYNQKNFHLYDYHRFDDFSMLGLEKFDISDIIEQNKDLDKVGNKDKNAISIFTNVQKLQAQSIHAAINLYKRGQISFSRIGKEANNALNRTLDQITVKIGDQFIPYTQYIKEFRNGKEGEIQDENIYKFLPNYENYFLEQKKKKENESEKYAEKFIEDLQSQGIKLDNQKISDIYSLFNQMFQTSNVKDKDVVEKIRSVVGNIIFDIDEVNGKVDQREYTIEQSIAKAFSDIALSMPTDNEDEKKERELKIEQLKSEYGIEKQPYVETEEIKDLKEKKAELQDQQNFLIQKIKQMDNKTYLSMIAEKKKEKPVESDPNQQNMPSFVPYVRTESERKNYIENPFGSRYLGQSFSY